MYVNEKIFSGVVLLVVTAALLTTVATDERSFFDMEKNSRQRSVRNENQMVSVNKTYRNVLSDTTNREKSNENRRNGRSFEILSRLLGFKNTQKIVNPKNLNCISNLSKHGICMTTSYCLKQGGQVNGNCRTERSGGRRDFKKCCVFSATCGDVITYNGTIFRNPHFPQGFLGPESCQTVVDVDSNVCQLRLDFFHFSLTPPRTERPSSGKCLDDVFTVNVDRGGSKVPSLCGDNSGQHVFVDVTLSQQAILNIRVSPESFSRKWAIQVLQIPCDSPARAPVGCLQYYTGTTNRITSFNYNPQPNGVHFLNDISYTMCVRRELGFCSITYRGESRKDFDIGPGKKPAVGAQCCTLAYLLIPTGSVGRKSLGNVGDRFCGVGLSSTGVVTSTISPFTLSFVSNDLLDESGVGPRSDGIYTRFAAGRQMAGFANGTTGKIVLNFQSSHDASVRDRRSPSRQMTFPFTKIIKTMTYEDISTGVQDLNDFSNSPEMDVLLEYHIEKYIFEFRYSEFYVQDNYYNYNVYDETVDLLEDLESEKPVAFQHETVLEGRSSNFSYWDDGGERYCKKRCDNNCESNCKKHCNKKFEDSDENKKCKQDCSPSSGDRCIDKCKENCENNVAERDSKPFTKQQCTRRCNELCENRCHRFCKNLPSGLEKHLCRERCKKGCRRKCVQVCDLNRNLGCDCECGKTESGPCRKVCQLNGLRRHWKAAGFNIIYSQNPCIY